MGLFRTRSDGRVFHVNNHNGVIQTPIGTTSHIGQEDKIRLINRITQRNKTVKESHEDKIAMQKLKQSEIDKKIKQRHDQQQSIIDEIETRRALLKKAKDDPKILDSLQEANPKNGSLPKAFQKEQAEKQKKFFAEETQKVNGMKESAEQDIKRAKDEIEKNEAEIHQLHNEQEELRKGSSNIPEINHANDIRSNEIVMQIAKLESIKEAFEGDIERGVNEIKRTSEELNKLRFISKNNAFGTIIDLPNEHKDTLPIPDEKELAKQRAKKSFEERKFGKGVAAIFPEGFQHKVKTRDPQTGEVKFSSKLPSNKKFIGFDKNHNPIFVEKEKPHEHTEPIAHEPRMPREFDEDNSKEQRLSIIPGLAREIE